MHNRKAQIAAYRKEVMEYAKRNGYDRSAWSRGVTAYALELYDENIAPRFPEMTIKEVCGFVKNAPALRKACLNGADNWKEFSWGGCSLIYNEDIAERLCNPTEFKRSKGGQRKPNSREEWLDTQARALYQACELIIRALELV